MHSEVILALCGDLKTLGSHRVWSLLVTVFGDLAAEEGAALPGPALTRIMEAMDIRPEATRVALHRLRQDNWITSRKSGRVSLYELTAHARAETATASKRIYADPENRAQTWQLVIPSPSDIAAPEKMAERGFLTLGQGIYIGASDLPVDADALRFMGAAVPEWVRLHIEASLSPEEYAALDGVLLRVEQALPDIAAANTLDRAVLRCLIVHAWRRLVLRHPVLPAPLRPAGWQGPHCAARAHRLLTRLPRPDPAEL